MLISILVNIAGYSKEQTRNPRRHKKEENPSGQLKRYKINDHEKSEKVIEQTLGPEGDQKEVENSNSKRQERPFFRDNSLKYVTTRAGKTALLTCIVENIGERQVSMKVI